MTFTVEPDGVRRARVDTGVAAGALGRDVREVRARRERRSGMVKLQ